MRCKILTATRSYFQPHVRLFVAILDSPPAAAASACSMGSPRSNACKSAPPPAADCEFVSLLLTSHLHQLNEVSAGIIKDSHPHRSGIRRLLDELNVNVLKSFELGVYVIDLE